MRMGHEGIDLPDSVEDLRALLVSQQALLNEQTTLIEAKQALAEEQSSVIDEQSDRIGFLEEAIRLLRSQRFAPKSEQASRHQLGLFNEAEATVHGAEGEDVEEEIDVPAHTRRKGGRRRLPDLLPRVEVVHDLSDAEKVCAHDASHTLTQIGEEVSEQLDIVPAVLQVIRHIRPKYACGTCKEGVRIAPMPPQPIPKSQAAPSLLAHVVTSKYVDGLPLHRQEKMLSRIGMDLPRSTLASWVVKLGELMEPLLERMREEIRGYDVVQCDETPFQVLKEPGKRAESRSYLWALYGGPPEQPLVVYTYDPSRSAEVPKRLLKGFAGFLQTDGYEGYREIGGTSGITHVGCWAHARRKFDEALRGQGKSRKKRGKSTPKENKARQGLAQIQNLYKLERALAGVTPEERHTARQERMAPLLEKLRTWLDAALPSVPPQSLTGKALHYLDGQWHKLIRVLDDGRLPLDTNQVENAIRPFVLGRKAWLFADTVGGARASANLYSLVETAKANEIEPWAYLTHLFERLPAATQPTDLEALLPHRIDRDALLRDA
jgi:transposase